MIPNTGMKEWGFRPPLCAYRLNWARRTFTARQLLTTEPGHVLSSHILDKLIKILELLGGGPRVVVSTAAFHARVRGSVPGLSGLKETKMFLPHPV